MPLDAKQKKQLSLAGSWIRSQRSAEAIPLLDTLIDQVPDVLFLWDERGRAKSFTEDHAGAVSDCTERITRAPSDPKGYTLRASAHERAGNRRSAIADYSSAIALDPNHESAFLHRGLAHLALGDFPAAVSDFSTDIRLSASLPRGAYAGLVNRGKARFLLGDLCGAITDLTEANHLDRSSICAPLMRGRVLLETGDLHAAIRDFSAAIAGFPKLTNAYRYRAIARALVDDASGAAEDLVIYHQLGGRDLPAFSCEWP